ncbi:MAG: Ig-like domain-containing protein, partial [Planctomyces sp.]
SVTSVNDAPTIDSLFDATISEDDGEQVVELTGISAGGGEVQPLSVTASSSNSGLIPVPTIVYTSADSEGLLKYTPVADQSGSAVITVVVEDGGPDGDLSTTGDNGTTTLSFTVTVTPVNDAPTLDDLYDVTITEDAAEQTVDLTGISAGGAESQPLKVTATSSNTALIADPTVIYTSANATGTVKYTPVADQHGTAVITVVVEDGGLDGNLSTSGDNLTVTKTFTVTVTPVNDAPTLDQPADVAIDEDAGEQTVSLTGISAGGGESQHLKVTASSSNPGLIATPTVVYTSADATGSLHYTPSVDQHVTSVITVVVEDGGPDGNLSTTGDNLTVTRTFT